MSNFIKTVSVIESIRRRIDAAFVVLKARSFMIVTENRGIGNVRPEHADSFLEINDQNIMILRELSIENDRNVAAKEAEDENN